MDARKIPNPFTYIGKLITGTASESLSDAAQKIDERDILRGLTMDVLGVFADNYYLAVCEGGFEFRRKPDSQLDRPTKTPLPDQT